jgi:hypothetical protein
MTRGYHLRKECIRKSLRKIVLVCEGKKTERKYFQGLKTRNSGVDIQPIHGKCTDPKSIVRFAEERISKWGVDFDDGDCVFCVYDVDENSDSILNDTYQHACTKNIEIILSNPCFEIWFLLHFKEVISPLTRQEVYQELKKFVSDYEKNKQMIVILRGNQVSAIERAKKLNIIHSKSNISLMSGASNPSTQVFHVLEHIDTLSQRNILRN